MYDSIIIGSGAGGLTAGVALSRAGKKVIVLEQHYVPGGWSHSFYLQGQKFSPGVHYLGGLEEGEQLRATYEGLGLAKELSFFKMVHTGFEHCIIGKEKFDYAADRKEFEKDLISRFPHEAKGIKKYLKIVWKTEAQIIRLSRAEKPLQKLLLAFRSGMLLKHGWKTLDRVISKYIQDPDLKAILTVQCGDLGLPPSKANFAYFTAVVGHYATGGYYPAGGGAAIVKAMTNELKKNGGEIQCKAHVKKIIIENKQAVGVELATGEIFKATNIVSNADPHITYGNLIDQQHLSDRMIKKLKKVEYSPSSLMLFITVDMDVQEMGIDSGNYWVSSSNDTETLMNYNSVNEIVSGDKFESVFISSSTLKDPSSFNGRYYNFELVTFIDSSFFNEFKDDSEQYQKYKEQISEKFLNNLEALIPGVKDHVVQMELGTPKTNKFFINATRGNVYGIAKTFAQIGPGSFNVKSEIDNLFLCGSSTLSHGVAGATNSGLMAAAQLLKVSYEDLLNNPDNDKLVVYSTEDPSDWPESIKKKIAHRKSRFENSLDKNDDEVKVSA